MRGISLSEARGKRVLVALSGGADSVALLLLLCEERDRGILDVCAAHFEHGIRGKESVEDAEFCKSLCKQLNVQFTMGSADVPEISRRTKQGIEACARKLRYDFLREVKVIFDCDTIALAHHMDDQAETVLMHLLRGSGPEGIVGMREKSGDLIRPLINVRKSEIIDYLNNRGQTWREDKTNLETDNPRNILRLKAIPAIEEAYPSAVKSIARYARNAALESEFIAKLTNEFMAERVEKLPRIVRINIEDCEEVLLRRAIKSIIGLDLTSDKLDEMISSDKPTDIVNGLRCEKTGKYLYIVYPMKTPYPALVNLLGVTELDGVCEIKCEESAPKPIKDDMFTQVLDRDAMDGAVIRTRMDGDFIRPLGMKGTKSLSDYFTDRKVDMPLRNITPIIAKGNNVLWAIGVGISEDCAVKENRAIKISCKYLRFGG